MAPLASGSAEESQGPPGSTPGNPGEVSGESRRYFQCFLKVFGGSRRTSEIFGGSRRLSEVVEGSRRLSEVVEGSRWISRGSRRFSKVHGGVRSLSEFVGGFWSHPQKQFFCSAGLSKSELRTGANYRTRDFLHIQIIQSECNKAFNR